MKPFNYFQPTDILFGAGRIQEIGDVVSRFGKRCLIVSGPSNTLKPLYEKIYQLLEEKNIAYEHFSGVIPNPTTECITEGADMAKAFGGYGERVTDPGEIRAAIQRGIEATESGTPALLEFITDKEIEISHG